MEKQEKNIEKKVEKTPLKLLSEKDNPKSEQEEQDVTDMERKDGWVKYGLII